MFNLSAVWWGSGGKLIFGNTIGWGRPLCALFPHLYYLSNFKNNFVAYLFVWLGSSYSFSFGFHPALSIREMMEVTDLVLLEGHPFRRGRSDVRFLESCPLEGFTFKSFISWSFFSLRFVRLLSVMED